MTLPIDWILPQWPAPASVRAFVTTRAGGVSRGPWGADVDFGMNLGRHTGDSADAVNRNQARLRNLLPAPPRWLRQEHGAVVADLDAPALGDGPTTDIAADASLTDTVGVVVAVQIADCLPVLLTDVRGRAVAAAHAGWRGLAAGVIQNAVAALRAKIASPSSEVLAWLGPAIGPLHFEVGAEVLVAMRTRLPDAANAFTPAGPGKYRADLFALARQALWQAGVTQIHGGGLCTYSDARRFYSFRRDRVTGRHAALIWRTE